MKKNLLITGVPGVGKTSLILSALEKFPGIRAGGFYTREVREEGERVGFMIVTLDGYKAPLAWVGLPSQIRVSKYGVALENVNGIAVEALMRALQEADIIIVDEIGKMECASHRFREAVLWVLDSPKPALGVVQLKSSPFTDSIKVRQDTEVLKLARGNAEQVRGKVEEFIRYWTGERK